MSDETFTCPTREWGTYHNQENVDTWAPNHGLVDQKVGCSYCGSMPPDDFTAALKAGAELSVTDKDYKAYIVLPAEDPEAPKVTMMATSAAFGLQHFSRFSAEEQELIRKAGYSEPENLYFKLAPVGETVMAKFYYPHLSNEQQREFVRMLNAKEVKFQNDFFFTVLPYFIQRPR